jgi:hypothetical protein
LNYAGVVCVLFSLCFLMGVKSDTGGAEEPDDGVDDSEVKLTDDKLTRLENEIEEAESEGEGSWVDKLTAAQRRAIGIPMACFAGSLLLLLVLLRLFGDCCYCYYLAVSAVVVCLLVLL